LEFERDIAGAAPSFPESFVKGYLGTAGHCLNWLLASERKSGGSAAHATPFLGWSRAYPETTGYIIPSLLDLGDRLHDARAEPAARRFGHWLLSIQDDEGYWRGGLYPYSSSSSSSVFNTGQILFGLARLAARDPSGPWIDAAQRGSDWLIGGLDSCGIWTGGHYRGHQPAYYTHVAWPMLEYAAVAGDDKAAMAAGLVLDGVLDRCLANGAIEGWGFDTEKPSFTHTIAYTLQGLLESAKITGHARWRQATLAPMERLRRAGELSGGRLPGSFDLDFRPDKSFECPTGSAQIALCCLRLYEQDGDLRWLNLACKLADRLGGVQTRGISEAQRGAIPGSVPFWGPYMRFRSPNWAAKFTADAMLQLCDALEGLE